LPIKLCFYRLYRLLLSLSSRSEHIKSTFNLKTWNWKGKSRYEFNESCKGYSSQPYTIICLFWIVLVKECQIQLDCLQRLVRHLTVYLTTQVVINSGINKCLNHVQREICYWGMHYYEVIKRDWFSVRKF
jgi:hypothetical protein